MARVVLDPEIFVLPPIQNGRASLECFVQSLLSWISSLSQTWVTVCISSQSLNWLATSNNFPSRATLTQAFRSFGVTEYSANDVASIINQLMSKAQNFESATGIEDLSWTHISVQHQPPAANERTRLLLVLAFIQSLGNKNQFLGIPSGTQGVSASHLVGIQATIDTVLTRLIPPPITPLAISEQVMLCDSLPAIIPFLNVIEIWKTANTLADIALAIKLHWLKDQYLQGHNDVEITDAPVFLVEEEFISSLQTHGFVNEEQKVKKLMGVLLDVLLKRNQQKSHRLRVDKGAGSKKLRKDTLHALRWDIDYEYHLHLWEGAEGRPTFSCVVQHNEFGMSS
jgi:hypothetical protein